MTADLIQSSLAMAHFHEWIRISDFGAWSTKEFSLSDEEFRKDASAFRDKFQLGGGGVEL